MVNPACGFTLERRRPGRHFPISKEKIFAVQPFQPLPRFQNAGHRPGLSRRAARDVGRRAVKDFADRAQPGVQQVIADRL